MWKAYSPTRPYKPPMLHTNPKIIVCVEEGRKLTVHEQGRHVTTPKVWTKRILLPVWAGRTLWFIMSLLFWSKYSKSSKWENEVHSFHSVLISFYLGSLWFASLLLGRAVLSLRIASWLHRIGQSVNRSPDPRLLLDELVCGVVRKAGQKKPCEIKTFPTSGIPVGQALLSGWGPTALSATPIRMKILRLSHARAPALCKDVGSALTHKQRWFVSCESPTPLPAGTFAMSLKHNLWKVKAERWRGVLRIPKTHLGIWQK